MKKSIKLQIRMSELRSEVNKLEPGDQNLAKRKELLGEIETAETEYRTALTEEANDPGNEHRADGLTAEEREFRSLDTRAELRNAFGAILNGAELAGPELELQRHRGFSGSELPWDLIAPRAKVVPVEHRVDARNARTGERAGQPAHSARSSVREVCYRNTRRRHAERADRRLERAGPERGRNGRLQGEGWQLGRRSCRDHRRGDVHAEAVADRVHPPARGSGSTARAG